MKQDNQNNEHTWAARLREYSVIPDRKISKEESWEKLRERLDNEPVRKRSYRYWLAAASVILLCVLTVTYAPYRHVSVAPGFTKTTTVAKQHDNTTVPTDSLQPLINALAKVTDSAKRKPGIRTHAGLQAVNEKPESVLPLPVEQPLTTAKDTSIEEDYLTSESTRLTEIHINDLITDEPLPADISIKSLSVKKMIRLFGTDFTGGGAPAKKEAIPKSNYSIPNNQN